MGAHLNDLIARRLSRRGLMAGIAGLPLLNLAACATAKPAAPAATGQGFPSLPATNADAVTVPEGYEVRTLIAWGDALFDDAPVDLATLTRAEQEKRFGAANDFLALFNVEYSFPPRSEGRSFLLCVNHEFFSPGSHFPGAPLTFTPEQVEAGYAAMGASVVRIEQDKSGGWRVVKDKSVNRRITPFTPVKFSGPAAEHPWIKAAAKVSNAANAAPEGLVACGTLGNCAGGVTPWGTYLTAEENFNNYFAISEVSDALNAARKDPAQILDADSFGYPLLEGPSKSPVPRAYDVAKSPTGPALYGWTVEIDPHDPNWAPRKRTALGRRKAECATTALTKDGRVAVYSGDDQVNEFVYKFVSAGKFDPTDRVKNRDLLDDGQLYVARFDEEGGEWIALTVEGANKAAEATESPVRFANEADLAMRARLAARLMGATPMDRPEDIESILDAQWVGQGPVLVVCTKNSEHGFDSPGNPRRPDPDHPHRAQSNVAGHILQLDEEGEDAGALRFKWDVFALGGDPDAAGLADLRNGAKGNVSVVCDGAPTISGARFACPDNLCIDTQRNVWITTDGSDDVFGDCNDQIIMMPFAADGPRPAKRFAVAPVGSEFTGPFLTPDERSLFVSVQHPGDGSVTGASYTDLRAKDPAARPFSTFPDGGASWPRSAVVVIRRKDGGVIGT